MNETRVEVLIVGVAAILVLGLGPSLRPPAEFPIPGHQPDTSPRPGPTGAENRKALDHAYHR